MEIPNEIISIWNARGLNSIAHRNAVRDEAATLICIEETKLAVVDDGLVLQLLGPDFDFTFLPANRTRGGILVAWRTDRWAVSEIAFHTFALSIRVKQHGAADSWWMTTVYIWALRER